MEELKTVIKENITLNGGGFSSPEVEALKRVLDKLVEEMEDLDSRVTTLEP